MYSHLTVDCGKCIDCRKKRAAAWTFRLMQQDKASVSSHFVTLTYDDENLTYADDGPTLVKYDLQRFFKRLRKRQSRKLKYYACGEYGGVTQRPHYHAIIFDSTEDNIEAAWHDPETKKPIGHVRFDPVNVCTIRYVCNYLQKSVDLDFGQRHPEFAVMSKGLGLNYLTQACAEWHLRNQAPYVVLEGGKKQGLPRYYKLKIFDDAERLQMASRQANDIEEQRIKTLETLKNDPVEYERVIMESNKQKIRSQIFLQKQRKL